MRTYITVARQPVATNAPHLTFPDYYAEERLALCRTRARQVRAHNALRLVGLMLGAAGLAGALRVWDAGLQP
ncbi:MAG TPA: hypothetical protein VKD90_23635 [Gemmataceae bacterium]|nr:hypothetical protein [Gemmataceae bacterium]